MFVNILIAVGAFNFGALAALVLFANPDEDRWQNQYEPSDERQPQ